MAGSFKLLYEQSFTSTNSITVTHNLSRVNCAIRVLIDGAVRNDLVSSVTPSSSDPRNSCVVSLSSTNTGVIQVTDSDYVWTTLPSPEASHMLENNKEYGTEMQFSQSLGASQFSGNAFSNKITWTTTSVPAGTYRVSWKYNWNLDSTRRNFVARVQVDDVTIGDAAKADATHRQEPQDSGDDQYFLTTGFDYITFGTAGTHTIKLDFYGENNDSTATIWNAVMEMWRVS